MSADLTAAVRAAVDYKKRLLSVKFEEACRGLDWPALLKELEGREDDKEEITRLTKRVVSLELECACPDCKCCTPEDADAAECGCDSAICSREGTLAESLAALREERDALRLRLDLAVSDLRAQTQGRLDAWSAGQRLADALEEAERVLANASEMYVEYTRSRALGRVSAALTAWRNTTPGTRHGNGRER